MPSRIEHRQSICISARAKHHLSVLYIVARRDFHFAVLWKLLLSNGLTPEQILCQSEAKQSAVRSVCLFLPVHLLAQMAHTPRRKVHSCRPGGLSLSGQAVFYLISSNCMCTRLSNIHLCMQPKPPRSGRCTYLIWPPRY